MLFKNTKETERQTTYEAFAGQIGVPTHFQTDIGVAAGLLQWGSRIEHITQNNFCLSPEYVTVEEREERPQRPDYLLRASVLLQLDFRMCMTTSLNFNTPPVTSSRLPDFSLYLNSSELTLVEAHHPID